jgi:hypothetical protein
MRIRQMETLMVRTVSLWIRIDGKYVHPNYANGKQTQLRPQDGEYYLRYAGKWHPVGSDPLLALDAKAAKEKLLRDVERGVVPVVEALPHLVKQPTRLTVAAAVTEYLVETKLSAGPSGLQTCARPRWRCSLYLFRSYRRRTHQRVLGTD